MHPARNIPVPLVAKGSLLKEMEEETVGKQLILLAGKLPNSR